MQSLRRKPDSPLIFVKMVVCLSPGAWQSRNRDQPGASGGIRQRIFRAGIEVIQTGSRFWRKIAVSGDQVPICRISLHQKVISCRAPSQSKSQQNRKPNASARKLLLRSQCPLSPNPPASHLPLRWKGAPELCTPLQRCRPRGASLRSCLRKLLA
jgi:hypothetical protein